MSGEVATPNANRYRALDGLRGVAALLVVLLHVEWPNHLTSANFIKNGYLAVDLFFILSGLVISANYSHKIVGIGDVKRFLQLRFFRLYPLHVAMLGVFVILECAKLFGRSKLGISPEHVPFTGGNSWGTLVANLLLVQGLGVVHKPNWNGPSWSISCEFFAYIAFAFVVLSGATRKRLFFVLGCAVAALAYTTVALHRHSLDAIFDFGIVRCLAGFFLGMLIFELTKNIRRLRNFSRYDFAAVIALVVAMSVLSGAYVAFVIPTFVVAILLLQTDMGPVAHALTTRPLQFLGRISYSIYMVHSAVIVCVLMVLKRIINVPIRLDSASGKMLVDISPWLGDALILGIVVAIFAAASVTFAGIEEPWRLYGRKFAIRSKCPTEIRAEPAAQK